MSRADNIALANRLIARMADRGVMMQPLRCAEIGARKPLSLRKNNEPFYELYGRLILAFEADKAEANRLVEAFGKDSPIHVVCAAVSNKDGEADLFITRNAKCSSLYPPDEEVMARYPGLAIASLDHVVKIRTVTLSSALKAVDWSEIHFLKMDVQGAELDVLNGAGTSLDRAVAVVTEVIFQPLYKGQPLAEDIMAKLRCSGFELYRLLSQGGLPRPSARRDQMQLLWSDMLFFRPPETLAGEDAARLAVFATLYGAFDIAECALQRLSSQDREWFAKEIQQPWQDMVADFRSEVRRIRGGLTRRMVAFIGGGR